MPNTVKKGTMAHPITGHRINLFSTDSTRDDKGVPDACKTCGITGKELMCCTRCKANGEVRIVYCSNALDAEKIKLYTKKPTTALQSQVEFLSNNPTAHYGFRRTKNGKYVAHQIQGKGGELFLQTRAEAMEHREMASIALMEKLLATSTLPSECYASGDYVPHTAGEGVRGRSGRLS